MEKNKKRIFLLCIFSFIVVFFREIYCAIVYSYNIALGRTNKFVMMKLTDLRNEATIMFEDFQEEKNKIKDWLRKTFVIGLKIKSFDGTTLFAEWFVNEKSKKWIIILHGYGMNGRMMYYAARKFYNKGYNILLPDLRGHGISGANYIGMGWHDRLDMKVWIKEIIKKDKDAEISLYGVSMGASTVLMTSGEDLPKNVKCVISDCAFTNAYDVFKHQFKKICFVPSFPLLDILSFICKIKNKYSLKEASALKQVKKCKIPIFFIHGSDDDFVPTDMVFELYKNAKCNKDLMIVNKAGHGVSEMVNKKVYWRRIFYFIDNIQ